MSKRNTFLLFFILTSCCQQKTFDKNIWKNYPEKRYQQALYLINHKILIGKNKQEIKYLLSTDCKYCDEKNDVWTYYLGEGCQKLDRKWELLDIEFKNEEVYSVSIR